MFSGIVETVGLVNSLTYSLDDIKLTITPCEYFSDLKVGDSIAINGVCLTITDLQGETFNVTAVPETLRRSNLQHLSIDCLVNLERAIKANDRIGGHYVQGHVDDMGEIIEIKAQIFKISVPSNLTKYIVNKGYIALDGMSITVIEANEKWFSVTLIPHTKKVSIAAHYQLGTKINIEVDILGKHIEKLARMN
ncbi:MAG: riboflavin synthase [Gammaproteobacteria bacterium]|nr:MAG: riboflavin synthase [Gammaproteobacteria bacterium]